LAFDLLSFEIYLQNLKFKQMALNPSTRASRRKAERANKKQKSSNLVSNSIHFGNDNYEVIDWQYFVRKAKENLVDVYTCYSEEVLEAVDFKISIDIQKQSDSELKFFYNKLDADRFIEKASFDADVAKTAILNYYNARIIESKKFNDLIAMMALAVRSSIIELSNKLETAAMIQNSSNKNIKIIEINDSYLKIKQDLINRRWINEEDSFRNSYIIGNEIVIEETPALRLVNKIYNMTLKPHLNGIEISRLEVYPDYQGKGYASRFLDNLLLFLTRIGVEKIYVMPFPSGFKTKNGISGDLKLLESFFFKRGFRPNKGEPYWELKDLSFLESIKEIETDYSLLEN
jgi:GNAT superfamily N-acetyltransferase